jgi:hypothetical protein
VFTVLLPGSNYSLLAPLFWPSALCHNMKQSAKADKNCGSCWKILFDKLNDADTKFYTQHLTFFSWFSMVPPGKCLDIITIIRSQQLSSKSLPVHVSQNYKLNYQNAMYICLPHCHFTEQVGFFTCIE